MTEALLGFLAIFVLALLRMPLAFSMGLVGIVGIGLTRGWMPAMASAAQVVHETGFAYTLSVIPLFILMGNFVARAGLLFGLAYLMWKTGADIATTGETTAQLKIAKAPFIQGMGVLCGLTGLVHVAKAFWPAISADDGSEGGTL